MYGRQDEEKAFDIQKTYDIIDERGNSILALRKVGWFGKEPKLELRKWRINQQGEETSGPGAVFLTEQGPHTLAESLAEHGFGDTNKILTSLSNRDDFDRNYKQVVSRDHTKTVAEISPLEEAVGSF